MLNAEDWLAEAWAHRPTEITVPVEGAQIACRAWQLHRTDLPGLILVHGFRAHARWWDHIAPMLCEDHRVVALDLSGMGDSDRRPAYTRAQHGQEILGVAAALGLHRPTIIAHSYGGVCSLIACRAMPDRVARAIIIDSALPTEADKSMVPSGPPRLYPDADTGLARFRLSPPGLWPNPQVLRQTPQGWTWKFDAAASDTLNLDLAYRDAMLDVRVPCNFIHGALSEIVTPERLAQVPAMMPLAGRPIVIPACHHHVLIEQPLALVAVLRALLAATVGWTKPTNAS